MVRPLTSTPPPGPALRAEELLARAILDGRYPAGSNLPAERDLAVELGVTRPTLREVLKQLDRDGFVTISHGRPTRVNDFLREGGLNVLAAMVRWGDALPEGFVRNLLDVRLVLAPAYARAAVDRDAKAVAAFLATLPDDGADAFAAFDWALHTTLAALSRNPVFSLILNGFSSFYPGMARLYFERDENRQASLHFYRELRTAAARSDGAAAERRTRAAMQESIDLWAAGERRAKRRRQKR